MITIDQLLESVNVEFEPRWVTKDKSGDITIFLHKPMSEGWCEEWRGRETKYECLGRLKLAEFENKPWTECIYEVPRKTTGKIRRFDSTSAIDAIYDSDPEKFKKFICVEIVCRLNKVIDAVNELKGEKNENI